MPGIPGLYLVGFSNVARIAHGMALYEFREPANRLFTTLFQAALNFRDYRLPELFCGIDILIGFS